MPRPDPFQWHVRHLEPLLSTTGQIKKSSFWSDIVFTTSALSWHFLQGASRRGLALRINWFQSCRQRQVESEWKLSMLFKAWCLSYAAEFVLWCGLSVVESLFTSRPTRAPSARNRPSTGGLWLVELILVVTRTRGQVVTRTRGHFKKTAQLELHQ